MAFRADVRAACVTMLKAYAASAGVKLQVYPARPRSIAPPTAFVDRIPESVEAQGIHRIQRTPSAEVVVLHGDFDSADIATQGDDFVDGFIAWVAANPHAAGANTTIGVSSVDDEPSFVPEWIEPRFQKTYFGSRITLEGFAGI